MQKVFIIGAGRSGTNLLRDMICKINKVSTWPCDEINYIWKHDLLFKTYTSDRLNSKDFSTYKNKYLDKKFREISKYTNSSTIVEKTCANSMRVDYIYKNFPKSKFIFIYRNGYDVVLSSLKRWKGKTSSKYLGKKFKFMPFSDIWFHIPIIFFTNLYKIFYGHYYKWGPIYKGIIKDKSKKGLNFVAIKQWIECVEHSMKDLRKIPKHQVYKLSYENLVANTKDSFFEICNFLDLDPDKNTLSSVEKMIDHSKVNGKRDYTVFSIEEKKMIEACNKKIINYVK